MKRKGGVLWVLEVLFLCALVSLPFYAGESLAQTKSLKIGLINSVTGPMAPSFRSMIEAAKPAADLMNERGGVTVKGQRYHIEIVTVDDQSSPPGAVAATNKLLQEGIKFIISPLFMPNFMATGSISEEAKVLRVNPSCADPLLFGTPNRLSFTANSTSYAVPYVYERLKSLYPKVKRVAIVRPDDPGTKFITESTEREIKKLGMEVVSNTAYKIPTDDFYPVLTKVLAQKPDSIEMITGIVPWAKGIIEQARELGFTGPITSVAPVGDTNQVKNALDPKYAYDIFMASQDITSPKMPPMIREFAQLVEKTSKGKTDFSHVLTLESLMVLVQGIQKAQSFETDKVAAALEEMTSIETPYGPGKFVGKDLIGANRLLVKNIPFCRIVKGGKMDFEFLAIK